MVVVWKIVSSKGVRSVTPIFCMKMGTVGDWMDAPVLSTATAERILEPAGTFVATALNGAVVLEAKRVLPR